MKILIYFFRAFLFSFFYFAQIKVHAIEIDFSRRQPSSIENPRSIVTPPSAEMKARAEVASDLASSNPATSTKPKPLDADLTQAIKKAAQPFEPDKEIIILNTEAGFVPEKISVKKGEAYKVHVVNLNLKEKNVSFMMDAFTQSYNTVYGMMKTFNIEPQVEGVYSYQCPETGIQGQMIVVAEKNQRKTASANEGE